MINVTYGDTNYFTAMAYGTPDPMTMRWCQERTNVVRQNLAPETQVYFNNAVGTVYDSIDCAGIAKLAKAIDVVIEGVWISDKIMELCEVTQLQAAPPVMIPWIMAHPEIREKYHRQEIAGYDEFYVDEHPEEHSTDFHLYREVTNGIFMDDPETGEHKAVYYFNDFDDTNLDFSDQISIMNTWSNILAHIQAGLDDPTSPYGAML